MTINELNIGDKLFIIYLGKYLRFSVLELTSYSSWRSGNYVYVEFRDVLDSKTHGLWIDDRVDLDYACDNSKPHFYLSRNEEMIVSKFKEICSIEDLNQG